MDNLFHLIDGNPSFRQFKLSDTLFTEYKCPEERSIFDIWSHLIQEFKKVYGETPLRFKQSHLQPS